MKRKFQSFFILTLLLSLTVVSSSYAEVVEYNLVVDYKTVNRTGKDVQAMAINDVIPGPTLNFKEGDSVRLSVRNNMDVETSMHWHGLLVPNKEDGVPYLNTPPIKPGETHVFEYTLHQSGTYWYHSHTGLQEQRGLFGAFVVAPRNGERVKSDKDVVVMLSDWTDENPDSVLRTLKSGNTFYSFKKGSTQSLLGAIRAGALKEVLKRNLKRMPPADVSDVAFDRFLANGQTEMTIDAEPGETVRLRFVNAAVSTYFYLQYAGGPMQIVSADANDVQPIDLNRFLMSIAETYDVIVKVPENGSYELRATAQDGSGSTSIFIGKGQRVLAPDVPKPNLYKMSMPMPMEKTKGMMKGMSSMNKVNERPWPPYKKLKSVNKTTLPKELPTREVNLSLTGDMERYIWSMDGQVLSPNNSILIKRGENARFTLVNKTMMHHPMHLHGHFFRIVNGQGDYSPLKHTVDVPPNSTIVIEFEGNEEQDWFFHCHILYHAKAGMARVVSYEDDNLSPEILKIRPNLYKDPWYFWMVDSALSNMNEGVAIASTSKNILSAKWQLGWRNVAVKTDYDVELAYDRYFNRFFTAFAGVNLTSDFDRGIFGVRYLLPMNLESALRVDTNGETRITVGRRVQLTNRLGSYAEFQYDTETRQEWLAGMEYMLGKNYSLLGQYHSDFGAGGGMRFRF